MKNRNEMKKVLLEPLRIASENGNIKSKLLIKSKILLFILDSNNNNNGIKYRLLKTLAIINNKLCEPFSAKILF